MRGYKIENPALGGLPRKGGAITPESLKKLRKPKKSKNWKMESAI